MNGQIQHRKSIPNVPGTVQRVAVFSKWDCEVFRDNRTARCGYGLSNNLRGQKIDRQTRAQRGQQLDHREQLFAKRFTSGPLIRPLRQNLFGDGTPVRFNARLNFLFVWLRVQQRINMDFTRAINLLSPYEKVTRRGYVELRGRTWLGLKKYAKAEQDCRALLKLWPGSGRGYLMCALASLHQGKYQQSVADFEALLRIAPGFKPRVERQLNFARSKLNASRKN